MHKFTGISAVVLCLGSCLIAEATPVYSFVFQSSAPYDPGSGTYQVQPGQTITMNVYLYEYSPSMTETYMAPSPPNAAEGLASAGVGWNITQNTAGTTVGTITGNTTEFQSFVTYLSTDPYPAETQYGVMSYQEAYASSGAYGTAVDPETTSLLIGSFELIVPAEATIGSTTTIEAAQLYSTISSNYSFLTSTPLEPMFDPGGTSPLILSVVPEPPSVVALCGLAAMGGLMWMVRRMRKPQRA